LFGLIVSEISTHCLLVPLVFEPVARQNIMVRAHCAGWKVKETGREQVSNIPFKTTFP
jgi:hypothetical protein